METGEEGEKGGGGVGRRLEGEKGQEELEVKAFSVKDLQLTA